jgi:hypothetical protein
MTAKTFFRPFFGYATVLKYAWRHSLKGEAMALSAMPMLQVLLVR